MRTKFEELVCSNETAQAFLSTCVEERGQIASIFYDWQTLISGVLAVAAALVTVIFLRIQIGDQRRLANLQRQQIEKEDRQEIRAALIQVPHALVDINTYLVACFEAWKLEKLDERPKPPMDALTIVMEAAAYVDDESFKSVQQLIISA